MLYLIDPSKTYTAIVRRLLYRHGFFSLATDKEAFATYLEKDRQAIALLLRPAQYSDAQREAFSLFCRSKEIPLMLWEEGEGETLSGKEEKHLVKWLFDSLSLMESQGQCRYLSLRHHGISDSLRDSTAKIFGLSLPLTKAQRMILRYLLYILPEGATAEELLQFCLSPERELGLSNIPTHIRQINQAFFPCYGCRIITHKAGAYRLMEDLPDIK